jgi:hypothetical protein
MRRRFYNQGFAGDFAASLPRGSRISWRGTVNSSVFPSGNPFSREPNQELQILLEGQGFTVERLTWETVDLGVFSSDFEIIIQAVTPVEYEYADDAFSVIKGDVWSVYGNEPRNIKANVLNVPIIDASGRPRYTSAPVNIQSQSDSGQPNPCQFKTGLDWLSCSFGFEGAAANLGFGAAAGTTLALAALVIVGVVILKK